MQGKTLSQRIAPPPFCRRLPRRRSVRLQSAAGLADEFLQFVRSLQVPLLCYAFFFLSSSNTGEGIFQSSRDIVHVLFGIAFVPRKNQNVRETRSGPREIGSVVVHRGFFGPAFSVVGPVTGPEGALIAKHL